MRFLYGDSTESGLEYNFLAYLREAIDCAVVMLEADATLAANIERRKVRDHEVAGLIRAVVELGNDVTALVEPVVKEQPKTPVGRCAASIAAAIKAAVEKESSLARTELATELEDGAREDTQVRARARAVVERLVRAHDFPGATKEYEVTWPGGGAKATMRQRTSFGIDVVISLDVANHPLFVSDLRVERLSETLQVHTHEAGGWLKKADKVVPLKLARYQIISVSVAGDTTIKMREQTGAGLVVIVKPNGDVGIEGIGSNAGKEFELADPDRNTIEAVASKLAQAARDLDQRVGLVSLDLDGKPFAEHDRPRLFAERLLASIAPTVQAIVRHGRTPGELVLRRQLANDRREEVFIPIPELTAKYAGLPSAARAMFAQLGLEGSADGDDDAEIVVLRPKSSTVPPGSDAPPADAPK